MCFSTMYVGLLVCSVLHVDVLNVCVRFSVQFCIYEHIQNYVFAALLEHIVFRNVGDATPDLENNAPYGLGTYLIV